MAKNSERESTHMSEQTQLDIFERKKKIKARFDNALLTFALLPGADGRDAVVTGWKHPIREHDEAAEKVEVQMREVEKLRRELVRESRIQKNWESAWLLMNERPEEFDEYLALRTNMVNFHERFALIKKPEEKATAEQDWKRFHELKPRCERLLEARGAMELVRKQKAEAFKRMKDADQRLEDLRGIETEAAEQITEDHIYADEKGVPISELFIGVFPGMIVTTINEVDIRGKPWSEIEDLFHRARKPHLLEFGQYPFQYNLLSGIWEPLEHVRARGQHVDDPRIPRGFFFQNCRFGEVAAVRRAIQEGRDVDETDATLRTGLHYAAANGHVTVICVLLDAQATLEVRDANRETPFLTACRRGEIHGAESLLDRGARIDARDNNGRTSFILGVQSGSAEIVEMLLKKADDSVQRHAPDRTWGWTPLHYAASLGDARMVSLFLDADASPYERARDDRQPLDLARPRSTQAIKLLDERIRADPAQCVLQRGKDRGEVWIGSRQAAYPKFSAERAFSSIVSVIDRGTMDSKLKWLYNGTPDTTAGVVEHFEVICNFNEIEDEEHNPLAWWKLVENLESTLKFIDGAVNRRRTVLVHCDLGQTASFAVVLAYMLTKRRVRLQDAKEHLMKARRELRLTPVLERGLEDLEEALDQRKVQRLNERLRHSAALAL